MQLHPTTSVTEQILRGVELAILGADTLAAQRVERGRLEAVSLDELDAGPAVVINRRPSAMDAFASGVDQAVTGFSLHLWASGADWESVADALHMQVHAALFQSASLMALGKGLICTDTDAVGQPGERQSGRLVAQYRITSLVTRAGLARASAGFD